MVDFNKKFKELSSKKLTWKELLESINLKNKVKSAEPNVTVDLLADVYQLLEREDIKVDYLFCNSKTYNAMRKLEKDLQLKFTMAEVLVASLWGAVIGITNQIPDNQLLIVNEQKNFGVLLLLNDSDNSNVLSLLEYKSRLMELSSEMQSTIRKTCELIKKVTTKIETLN